jgi:hypothetical protein
MAREGVDEIVPPPTYITRAVWSVIDTAPKDVTTFETYASPLTCKALCGLVVLIPTRLLVLKKMFAVAAATPDDTR